MTVVLIHEPQFYENVMAHESCKVKFHGFIWGHEFSMKSEVLYFMAHEFLEKRFSWIMKIIAHEGFMGHGFWFDGAPSQPLFESSCNASLDLCLTTTVGILSDMGKLWSAIVRWLTVICSPGLASHLKADLDVRFCCMRDAYDKPTTRIVLCKSNLQLALRLSCTTRKML